MDISANDDILLDLPDLTRIIRFCEPEEISLFLGTVITHIDHDFLQMESWTLQYNQLLMQVDNASCSELKSIHDNFNRIEIERFLLTGSVTALHANCTDYRDLIATRTLSLVTEELASEGKLMPDISYSLISMGSDGREEQTLITDQDYLIIYEDGGNEAADSYFKEFSTLLVERLEEAGFKKCTGGIMPVNGNWRGSYSQWRKRLLSILMHETEDYAKNMMDLIVLSDARYVAGNRRLAEELVTMIREMEKDFFQVFWGMAKAATEMRLALGFMKRLWTEKSGEYKGSFNLKLLAWAPLVMNIRILAINQGIPATKTVERIAMLEKEGSFSATAANDLQEAYLILTKHRILLQIKILQGLQNESHHLNPDLLPICEREHIRHAIIRIEELQKNIHTNFSIS